ncbi:MAG: phosphate ABC transporter permease subunit PstC [Pseudomonadota bacterium]
MTPIRPLTLIVIAMIVGVTMYFVCSQRISRRVVHRSELHSMPVYHGLYAFFWSLMPVILLLLVWSQVAPRWIAAQMIDELAMVAPESASDLSLALNELRNIADGDAVATGAGQRQLSVLFTSLQRQALGVTTAAGIALLVFFAGYVVRRSTPQFRAREAVERYVRRGLFIASSIAVLTTLGIIASVLFESVRFFTEVPVGDFLFGTEWRPQTAIRDDQIGSSGAFGAIPLFAGTVLIATIALAVAAPVGLMTAIYLSEYAHPEFRAVAKPILEILAGIPTVVYGFFAAISVAPAISRLGDVIGANVASESALAAGLVIGIMILPLISSLADDALTAVPAAMKDGSLAMGATRSETIRQVLLPAALPGIVGGFLLAISRAIGETMIVVMAAGLAANLTANPFEAVTTVTVQIVTLLVGDQEFDSAKTLAAFALGLFLFVVTLGLNAIGLRVVRRYREQYE